MDTLGTGCQTLADLASQTKDTPVKCTDIWGWAVMLHFNLLIVFVKE